LRLAQNFNKGLPLFGCYFPFHRHTSKHKSPLSYLVDGGNSSLQVAADGSAMYILPTITLRQINSNVSERLVLKVTSMSSMFTLSGLLSEIGSAESFLALPLEALGTEYIVHTQYAG